MKRWQPTQLRAFLREIGVRPSKPLSQNFLIDGNIVRKIVNAAALQTGDTVLEIGPGPGALTQALLDTGAHLVAVEKDRCLASNLPQLTHNPDQLTIHCADFLKMDLTELIPAGRWTAVSNLPYSITTPILTKLLTQYPRLSRVLVMVQKEVAYRLVATPADAAYGSLSLFVRMYSKPRYLFSVSRNCFYPTPKVDSAVVQFDLHPPQVTKPEALLAISHRAFRQRRKMLRSSLGELWPSEDIERTLKAIGKEEKARPEQLSLEDWITFVARLQAKECSRR